MNTNEVRSLYRNMGANPLSPDIITTSTCPNGVVELSSGVGFDLSPHWGVSAFLVVDGALRPLAAYETDERVRLYWNCGEAMEAYRSLVSDMQNGSLNIERGQ